MSTIYQLKIELPEAHPKVWRRITVPIDISFEDLHYIIQISMGYEDAHEFEFKINETTVRDFGPEIDTGDNPHDRDTLVTFLDELVTMVKTKFTYVYNLQDHLYHQITLEKIATSAEKPGYPACIEGEGANPSGELFDIEEVNALLRRYSEEQEELDAEMEDPDLDDEDDDLAYDDEEDTEYERLKHLKSPQDVLNDEESREAMEEWINDALADKSSVEYKTFMRLVNQSNSEEKATAMILEALSIEWFYERKYGIDQFDKRYEYNLNRLPHAPEEIPSLDYAAGVLDKSTRGIPFAAIEYLHNDISSESTAIIVKALRNFSDHQYCWADCINAPIWYSFAAEGHIVEELIDAVIGFYGRDNKNETDMLHEQGQYLIGKLAQKYPDITVQKVLATIEKDAEVGGKDAVYFLFDVFDFCNIDKYKDRLIALLKRDDISWHDMFASTISHLQIKDGLPILKEQLRRLESKKEEKNFWNDHHITELEEAIEELEKGEDYHDVAMPICLTRGTTWREEYADAEEGFYDNERFGDDDFDWGTFGQFDQDRELSWNSNYDQQPIIKENKTGRNDPCPCGSGKKYKKCCLDKEPE
ncbi:MAG TPA: SEC-C metal-binding domain-containing protein [Ohtaekwangia sp.]|nr:SEC-C metal-binding domain-containing protein [Ohtaekwangia sp.]